MTAVAVVTGKLVQQQLHRADVQVQLVHVVLAEVTDLQVPEQVEQRSGGTPAVFLSDT